MPRLLLPPLMNCCLGLVLLTVGLLPRTVRAAAPPTPSLLTERLPDGRLRVLWQSPVSRMLLEASPALGSRSLWKPVSQTVREDEGTFSVDLPPSLDRRFLRLRLPLTSLASSSPSPGESGVSVQRETILHLSGPLAADAVLGHERVQARFAERALLTRTELSTDRRRISLFYLEPLPGNARVSISFNGTDLHDEFGLPLDPDGDGLPGGTARFWFDTLNLTPIQNTAVVGQVFAATPAAVADGQTLNQPLAGVTITVDGREQDLRAVTDAQGFFRLQPVPAGRFFVHIDGRTAPSSQYPDGLYYPAVGKAWDAVAGITNNLAGGTGEIYLPLIEGAALQPVSAVNPTTVGFASSVVATNPALALARITVPPNSLFSDDGSRGGRIGMAPVPPDRLPGPLPPGLELANVFTVQTDGALNLDRPAAVCLPNLPEVVTGAPLAPGARRSLVSFDHKKGIWESVGLMTVSADGSLLCTDPGVGIRQPGWHGAGVPAYRGSGGVSSAGSGSALGSGTSGGSGFGGSTSGSTGANPPAPSPGTGGSGAGSGGSGGNGGGGGGNGGNGGGGNGSSGGSDSGTEEKPCPETGLDECLAVANAEKTRCDEAKHAALDQYKEGCDRLEQTLGIGSPEFQACFRTYRSLYFQATLNCNELKVAYTKECAPCAQGPIPSPSPNFAPTPRSSLQLQSAPVPPSLADQVRALLDQATERLAVFIDAEQPIPDAAYADAQNLFHQADALAGGDAGQFLIQQAAQTESEAAASFDSMGRRPGNAPSYPIRFHALIHRPSGPVSVRGETGPFGQYEIFVPSDGTLLAIEFYDPISRRYGLTYPYLATGAPPSAPPFRLFDLPLDATDFDRDGLPDLGENVIGTHPSRPDSDNDGVPDGTELEQGANPLDGIAVQAGIIVSVDTPGRAADVAIDDDLAVVADGPAGIAVFDISNPLRPILAGQVDTPGDARAVSISMGHVVVADGSEGVALIDLAAPLPWQIRHQLPFSSAVVAVTTLRGVAFVALENREIVALDLFTSTHLGRLKLAISGAIQDLAADSAFLYVLTASELVTVALDASMTVVSKVPAPGLAPGSFRRRRLALADGLLYASHRQGFTVFDRRDPANPTELTHHMTAQFGWRQVVPFAPGLAVATTGPNSTEGNDHHLELYDLGPQRTNAVFLSTIRTPGSAVAVASWKGLAFLADDQSGLQIIHVRAADSLGLAPTLSLTDPTLANPSAVVEGQAFQIHALAADDNLVRTVEFSVNGQPASIAGRHPFSADLVAPLITPGNTTMHIQARATDTSGNSRWSEPLTVSLLQDSSPPEVEFTIPADGRYLAAPADLVLGAAFAERLAPSTVNAATFQVLSAGTNGIFGDTDDHLLTGTHAGYREDVQTAWLAPGQSLGAGRYRAILHSAITDVAGNALQGPIAWEFEVVLVDLRQGGSLLASGQIERGAAEDVLAFQATAGQTFYFDEVIGTCNSGLIWRCQGPDGAILFNERLGGLGCGRDAGRLTLPLDGTYTLAVTGENGSTNAWQIGVHNVPDPVTFPLVLGHPVAGDQPAPGAGRIETPGSLDQYVFSATAGQGVFFHETTGDCTTPLSWTCLAPDGAVVFDETLGGSGCGRNAGRVILPQDGDYRIQVRGNADATGTYGLTVWDATPQVFDITTPSEIRQDHPGIGAGHLETPGAADVYRFTAAPGSRVRFEDAGASPALTGVQWSLTDEDGTAVIDSCLSCTDPGVVTLSRGGTYTLTVGDLHNAGTGTYTLSLTPTP